MFSDINDEFMRGSWIHWRFVQEMCNTDVMHSHNDDGTGDDRTKKKKKTKKKLFKIIFYTFSKLQRVDHYIIQ